MSAGEVMSLARFRDGWRSQIILKPAIIPSAEVRASQSASWTGLALDFENWIGAEGASLSAPKLFLGHGAWGLPPSDAREGHPLVAPTETDPTRRVVAGRVQFSAYDAPEALLSNLIAEAKSWSP